MRQNAVTRLDRRDRRADARDLRLRLEAAADDPEPARARARKVLRRDAARRAGTQLAEHVRLDDCDAVAALGIEQHDDERGVAGDRAVGLAPGEAEPAVDRRHDRKRAALEREPQARLVHHLARAPGAGRSPRPRPPRRQA